MKRVAAPTIFFSRSRVEPDLCINRGDFQLIQSPHQLESEMSPEWTSQVLSLFSG
jgi:hypothetical protein